MKRFVAFLAVICILGSAAQAQALTDAQKAAAEAAQAISNAPQNTAPVKKVSYWKSSMEFNLGFNQTSLTNWAAGGYNTITLATGLDAKANYAKDLLSWNNRAQLNYGFLWSADKENLLQKSNDRIYIESKFAYKTQKDSKWNYSASFDFRTQFTNSYDSYVQDAVTKKWDGTLKSGFMAPAYTNLALGLEWIPNSWLDVNIAPVTGGLTICRLDTLKTSYGLKDGKSVLFQFGAQVKSTAKVSINDKLNLETQLVLFFDYLNRPTYTNFPIRVNWDNSISWKISKLFKLGFNTWLIYDPNVTIKKQGESVGRDRVQFKEFLSFSFTYTIASK